ncbi:MAG: hypothetical protein V1672_02285 [Candidatus Diapherotrites archaeon]
MKNALESLKKVNETSKERKFAQSIELIINFRGLNFKKPENQIDVRVELPHATGKISGKSLLFAKDTTFVASVKNKVDRIIMEEEISKLSKKDVGLIISQFDILMAEGPVMLTVGKHLGQILAPKGKMPSPVQPTDSSVRQTLTKLSTATRVTNKKGKFMPLVQVVVGKEGMPENDIAENMVAVYNSVLNSLPGKKQNIKNIYVKKTMSPAVKVVE